MGIEPEVDESTIAFFASLVQALECGIGFIQIGMYYSARVRPSEAGTSGLSCISCKIARAHWCIPRRALTTARVAFRGRCSLIAQQL